MSSQFCRVNLRSRGWRRPILGRALSAICACLSLALPTLGASPGGPPKLTIRVGISVYDDSGLLKDKERRRYEELFSQLRQRTLERFGVELDVQYQAATYSEVVHWCTHRAVDIAVLSPGAYNELVRLSPAEWQYLCTMGQPVDPSPTDPSASTGAYRFEYGLKCVVKRGSPLLVAAAAATAANRPEPGLQTLSDAYDSGQLALYFVDPLSVSGGIAPLYLLRHHGGGALRNLSPGQVEYTQSHSRSLGIVAEQIPDNSENFDSKQQRVAFVWDGAALEEDPEAVEVLPLSILQDLRIPESAIVVSTSLYEGRAGQNQPMLDALHLDRPDFHRVERHQEKYGAITRWREYITQMQTEFEDASDRYAYQPTPGYQRADWTAFFRELDSYCETHDRKPRIAVVFGGGGAKCAYQAGAMEVLERKLREDRQRRREIEQTCEKKRAEREASGEEPGYDISLVVGTSGGALNALPTALGISKTDEGMQSIQSTWRQLDGRDIINPELAIRFSVGGWLFILHLVGLLVLLRVNVWNRSVVTPEKRFRTAYRIMLALGAIHVVSWALNVKWPWSWLSWIDYSWYPVWIFLASGVSVCGILLTLTGLGMWVYSRFISQQDAVILSNRFVREAVVWVTLVFIVVEIPIALFCSTHISDDQMFERQVRNLFVDVLRPKLATLGREVDRDTTLSELSRAIFDEELLQRDLIISATTMEGIDQSGGQKDVYFYAQAAPCWNTVAADEAPPAPQFHNLNRNSPDQLFDALIGSGTVFPIFPPRRFGPLQEGGKEVTLVDGGFSHNNPVEAAVQWGATHIILVKPSQDLKHEEGENLLANAGRAFSHLFEQAQAVDTRAMSETQLFVLRPESKSHQIPLLCFASDPIGEVIDLAKKETESHSPFLAKFR